MDGVSFHQLDKLRSQFRQRGGFDLPDALAAHPPIPAGKTVRYQRGLVRITGRLSLNSDDPEEFLYTVKDAKVGSLD